MPPQNGVRRHDRRDLAQCRASQAVSTHREATPLIIRESQPSPAQLGTQDAILFHQVPDHVLLTSTEPAREGREEYLKRGNGSNHGGATAARPCFDRMERYLQDTELAHSSTMALFEFLTRPARA